MELARFSTWIVAVHQLCAVFFYVLYLLILRAVNSQHNHNTSAINTMMFQFKGKYTFVAFLVATASSYVSSFSSVAPAVSRTFAPRYVVFAFFGENSFLLKKDVPNLICLLEIALLLPYLTS